MEVLGSWIGGGLIIMNFIYLIAGNAIRFINWIKCRKVSQCRSTQCCYRRYCGNWIETYTQEDIDELYKMLEEFKSK